SLEFPGLAVQEWATEMDAARVDLFLLLEELPHGFDAVWEYSTDLFDRTTIDRMQTQFLGLLAAVVADLDRPIDDLELLTDREREVILGEWNSTASEVPDACAQELVAAQASAAPERVAVEFEGTTLTYGELERRSNRLAH